MDTSASTKKRKRWCVKCLASVLLTSCMLFGIWPASGAEEEAVEFQVKSAFLYNLPKFVRWPAAALDDSRKNLMVCVIGHEDMRDYLYKRVDRPTSGYALKVSFRSFDAGLAGCQMAYIGRDSRLHTLALLDWCQRNHILTVGVQPGFIELGGIIGFALLDERVQLVISRSPAQTSGLQISAKLFELAQIVE